MTTHRLTATSQPIFSPRPQPRLTRPIEIDALAAAPAPDCAPVPGVITALDKIAPEGRETPAPPAAPAMPPIFSTRPKPVLTSAIPAPAPDLPHVVSIGTLIQGGRWRTEAMRSYGRAALYWFTRGQGRATIAGHRRGFTPHTAFLVPPGEMHGFDLIGNVAGSLVLFPRSLSPVLQGAPARMAFRDGQRQMELTGLIDALRLAGEVSDDLTETALGHQAGLLAIWLRRAEGERLSPDPRDLAAVFTDMIGGDFARGLTVADYAARIGVTPTHLSRVCRAASGRSAHTILTSRRLFEARRLLADTGTPVTEIAGLSGFGSAAYFSRAFRKAVGQSPSAFRQGASRHGTIPT